MVGRHLQYFLFSFKKNHGFNASVCTVKSEELNFTNCYMTNRQTVQTCMDFIFTLCTHRSSLEQFNCLFSLQSYFGVLSI